MKKRLSYTSIILLFVYFSCQPNVKVERDDNTPIRLVYDPGHPDAVKIGPKKGYVEYCKKRWI